jgi:hypothetical protein
LSPVASMISTRERPAAFIVSACFFISGDSGLLATVPHVVAVEYVDQVLVAALFQFVDQRMRVGIQIPRPELVEHVSQRGARPNERAIR